MKVLVTGARGQLGRDLVDAFSGEIPTAGVATSLRPAGPRPGGVLVTGAGHDELAVEDRDAVFEAVDALRPDVVVHAGAWTAVDACESDPDRAYRVNALGTRHIAQAAEKVGAHVVYVSTDYVFDGTSHRPYVEWDQPNPVSVYGKSKWGGEQECSPGSTIVRTSWVCGAHGNNMVKTALKLAKGEGTLRFVDDQHGSPTFTADLASAIVTLAAERREGVFHVTNQGATTWFGFVRAVLSAAGQDPHRVEPIATKELDPPRPAPRPANSVLENSALRNSGLPLLPQWEESLVRLVHALATVE